MLERRQSRQIKIGNVLVGGGAPISVQSMTNTRTDDIVATLEQIGILATAGCEIVRLAVPDEAAAKALAKIKQKSSLPIIADIHFDYRLAIMAAEQGIDGLRLNPGNIGGAERVAAVVAAARQHGLSIRIGVNAGSLEKDLLIKHGGHVTAAAMVESALAHVRLLEKCDFNQIKISLKAHDVPLTIDAYRQLAAVVDYPLHVGITEAGTIYGGTIKSSVGIGALLAMGIGDTIRVSLTGDPVKEVRVAKEILKSLGLRQFGATMVSCPTCGRTAIDLVSLAEQVEARLATIDRPITVAVMGCVVNGPGEAREADVGIAGGKGEGLLFRKGEVIGSYPEEQLLDALFAEIDKLTGDG